MTNVQSRSSDSFDPNIIPAETAARKDREGDRYKQTPASTSGQTVDQEGLTNNYAAEPEMYFETPGDSTAIPNEILDSTGDSSTAGNYTIVDIFPSSTDAENAVMKMKEAGLDSHKISIIGGGYQNTNHVQDSSSKSIEQHGEFAAVLVGLGIVSSEALMYQSEVESGKFVVLVVGTDDEITQANKVLHAIGHRTLAEANS
jgi:hypothetical protein